MADLTTNISEILFSEEPIRQTNLLSRFQGNSKIDRVIRPIWTKETGADDDDVIPLAYLNPGEVLLFDLCSIYVPVLPDTLILDIGFRALDGAASALAKDGTEVPNNPVLFADGVDVTAGGKFDFFSTSLESHYLPNQFAERVQITSTIDTIGTLVDGTQVRFNIYTIFS